MYTGRMWKHTVKLNAAVVAWWVPHGTAETGSRQCGSTGSSTHKTLLEILTRLLTEFTMHWHYWVTTECFKLWSVTEWSWIGFDWSMLHTPTVMSSLWKLFVLESQRKPQLSLQRFRQTSSPLRQLILQSPCHRRLGVATKRLEVSKSLSQCMSIMLMWSLLPRNKRIPSGGVARFPNTNNFCGYRMEVR